MAERRDDESRDKDTVVVTDRNSSNPVGWIIGLILLLIVLFFLFANPFGGGGGGTDTGPDVNPEANVDVQPQQPGGQ